MVLGPHREFAVAERTQLAAQRRSRYRQREVIPQHLGQIDDPPAHDTMGGRYRPPLDRLDQRRAVGRIEERRLPGRFPIDQPVRTRRVELHHPVSDDLQGDAADPRRLCSARTIINRRQRKQTPGLRPIFRVAGRPSHRAGVEIAAKRNRQGKLLSVCHLESAHAAARKPPRVTISVPWYNANSWATILQPVRARHRW